MRTWKMLVWNGKKYVLPTSDGIAQAEGPKAALKIFGLTDHMYTVTYSRKGYGYFTGRVEVRSPETVAAGINCPLPADFVLLVINDPV